ncbi:hypothetical protein BJ508DRAFT_213067 [Ascobolus immersus RN42]|uniref:Alpha N-terminal protein methyltransferase 1 n=1 Tax=Ascobolus immersus RN42 TaxID=1160509 RepID=A0A3N4HTJ7_ASCIM|nr:hypothetical protein BJ508DRAFT_213067 [Ascobolus immersus RN42]
MSESTTADPTITAPTPTTSTEHQPTNENASDWHTDNDSDASDHHPDPDSLINHAESIKYWESITSDNNGMLGGFPQISRIDLQHSSMFLKKLLISLPPNTPTTALDCGAGIGRITHNLLLHYCTTVDVLEPVKKFTDTLASTPIPPSVNGKLGTIYNVGLEGMTFNPERPYAVIWIQWCFGHLTDAEGVQFLRRVKEEGGLAKGGYIVVKENVVGTDGEKMYDETDSSVTRSENGFRALFREAGYRIVRDEMMKGVPRAWGLFAIRCWALKAE